MMKTVKLDLPDTVLEALKESPEGLSRVIRMAAAVRLYETGKLSSGRAAELAGIPRIAFFQELGHQGVPLFNPSVEEFQDEIRNL